MMGTRILQAWHLHPCFKVFTFVECLAKASRHVLLSGDWLSQEKVSRDYLETLLKKCISVGAGKKETVEAVLALAQKPWDSQRVRNLLTGRTELQQQGSVRKLVLLFTRFSIFPYHFSSVPCFYRGCGLCPAAYRAAS